MENNILRRVRYFFSLFFLILAFFISDFALAADDCYGDYCCVESGPKCTDHTNVSGFGIPTCSCPSGATVERKKCEQVSACAGCCKKSATECYTKSISESCTSGYTMKTGSCASNGCTPGGVPVTGVGCCQESNSGGFTACSSYVENTLDACAGTIQPNPCSTYPECKKGCCVISASSCAWSQDYNKCIDVDKGKWIVSSTCTAGSCPTASDPSLLDTDDSSSSSSSGATLQFFNPIKSNSIDEMLTSFMDLLKGFVVALSIIFIVIGGILYMISSGDSGMIKRAKDCWLFSVIGFSIVIAAPAFLKQLKIILGGTMSDGRIDSALTFLEIASNTLTFLLSIIGIIAIISLVIAGGMYLTAYGSEKKVDSAKTMATWSIVGITIALISLIMIQQIEKLIIG